jgi:hypothetical protein
LLGSIANFGVEGTKKKRKVALNPPAALAETGALVSSPP